MVIGSIYQEEIPTLNIYAANNRDSKYMKQNCQKGQDKQAQWYLEILISLAQQFIQKLAESHEGYSRLDGQHQPTSPE